MGGGVEDLALDPLHERRVEGLREVADQLVQPPQHRRGDRQVRDPEIHEVAGMDSDPALQQLQSLLEHLCLQTLGPGQHRHHHHLHVEGVRQRPEPVVLAHVAVDALGDVEAAVVHDHRGHCRAVLAHPVAPQHAVVDAVPGRLLGGLLGNAHLPVAGEAAEEGGGRHEAELGEALHEGDAHVGRLARHEDQRPQRLQQLRR